MSVLARSPLARIQAHLAPLQPLPPHRCLRAPQCGTLMVRARAGGRGERFNLAEMSVCRASVVLDDGLVGHAYVAGNDGRHAELAALMDAMLQDPTNGQRLWQAVIAPLARELEQRIADRKREVERTRVEFFTLVRPEDACA
ncbi:MAG: phosphonate C-P lyase system protein PhnG [Gammaproteobacteria bacterium]|nr:phosphonate C-P lyase system protein PhnG [Gammaproteobacteria bacterium]